ncbi:ring-1,2-phenylacetyl-CoA epoxidase subunit PaaB [Halogranum amylolyticum]|uniref:Ring-1,2-phenylacetyl-CoA epoxidase subunit PaaB n=1 Tax=Halogranum amylolyticum TaxID=660520 RepID=A0A1H8WQT7_9EURY|nr:1,2-phenylacetyl-CoA epoxidase subunit PaaB [Halogranum amylolyticum]SEP30084.1 ring-1,2-phenylacetyl-CoA epoxidase subunit PaaB [Halogranum amylolyticum]
MIWEVFRQEDAGDSHTHVGNVHAPDREMALLFAQVQHARRKPTNSLWVASQEEIGEMGAEESAFGGTTNKSYRWAMTYNYEPTAEEVAESESEQAEADRARSGD